MTADWESFIHKQDSLVIGEEHTAYYQLVSVIGGDVEEVWNTFPAPVKDSEEVGAAIRQLADSFPKGRHILRLQAVTASKVVRAQIAIPIDGTNTAITKRGGAEEHLLHARTLKANVEVAEQQLATMQARLQTESTRNDELQEKLVNYSMQSFEMMNLLQNFVNEREDREMKRAEHQARLEGIAAFAEKATPLLLPLVGMAVQYFSAKMEDALAKDAKEPAEPSSPEPSQSSE